MEARVNSPEFITSLNAAAAATDSVALCEALHFADASLSAGAAPEWVHLLPAGDLRTRDGRGPYKINDLEQLAADSLKPGERLIIDENHATDIAAPKGLPAPAAGWIVALQARADGLWGKVEWTPSGAELVAGRRYRGISPNILHDRTGRVVALQRASLVNIPNLKGLTTLHMESHMDLIAQIAQKLGLDAGAAPEAILAALDKVCGAGSSMHAQLSGIAQAAGLGEDATVEAILATVSTLAASPGAGNVTALQSQITGLQSELVTVTTALNAIRQDGARAAAEAFVDGAIKAGRVGVKPLRDHYVTRHMANAADVEKEIGALPVLNGQSVIQNPGAAAGRDAAGKRVLTDEQEKMVALMSLDRDLYIQNLDAAEQRYAAL